MQIPIYLFIFKIKKRLKMLLMPLMVQKKERYLRRCNVKSPIIVLGNQKTGSTAIAYLLSQASGKSATLDIVRAIPDVNWQLGISYKVLPFQDFVWRYRNEFSSEIIKEPSLTFFYPELSELFPNAQFVFIQRDPFQNIRSILNRLKIPGDLRNIDFDDYDELRKYPIWRLALNSHWLGCEGGSYIEALAHRWDISAKIFLENQQKFYLIKYEDFLSNKKNSIDNLCKELGLAIIKDVSKNVDEQHQSKGRPDTDLRKFFGDENYAIIESICSESGRRLGYFNSGTESHVVR